ncbi:tetratricopeptide repeat protein [Zobellella sp. DQSA1]|uniref:O-linked N-acetylglucosamine transferase, SPINDLY family protein n=1 Tax=Zobellella sp. DQSA1 TaxID=3342386 RepID=UPI0035BFBEEE
MAKKFIKKQTKQARLQTPGSPLAKAKLEALSLFNNQQYQEAQQLLQNWLDRHPQDADLLYLLGRTKQSQGLSDDARNLLEQSVTLEPNKSDAWAQLAQLARHQKRYGRAEECIDRALTSNPDHLPYLLQQSEIWTAQYRLDEAIALLKKQAEKHPKNHALLNTLANRLRETGQLDDSIHYLKQAMAAGDHAGVAYSNYLTLLHYHPDYSKEQILEVARGWEKCHAPKNIPARPEAADKSPGKRIRLGMFSDGFRSHPVGQMITSTLDKLPKHEIELYAYSSSEIEDHFTKVIKKRASQWMLVNGYSNERFAEQIREDKIDILVDLSGHNAGTFMQAVTMQPAPVIVKWVGGLISSTGVSAIDYLLSDRVETPEGEDAFFTEKLVRLPNDYICYTPPPYLPEVAPAPVHQNGYITLGCFNNPTKLNPVLLEQWALLLHGLPNSRLFLKGREFGSEHLRRQVLDSLARHAITEERVIIEGGSPHKELLASYNRVDIALDPWPYSGGLTTCEAMAMGVPVVTLPGPTFAGRHSATHLVNAGMANLVANDWPEYLFKVMTLANNVDILDNLRTHLRPALLGSPVCDAKLFAHHLGATFRAIWQRYCEGKAPSALSFTQDDQPIFADEAEPMALQYPPKPEVDEEDEEFSFTFEGRIVTVDHGGLLVGSPEYLELHNTGAFNTICFDPTGRVKDPQLLPKDGYLHHYPMACLTDGGPATLYLGHDPDTTGSLKPLPADQQPVGMEQVAEVISELPLTTTRLQDIQGLDHIDWLILDNMHGIEAVLDGAGDLIDSVLLIQIKSNFISTHKNQKTFDKIHQIITRYDLDFLQLKNQKYISDYPVKKTIIKKQASQLITSDFIFIKSMRKLINVSNNRKKKLSFILHNFYKTKDTSYRILDSISPKIGENYLISNGIINKVKIPESPRMSISEQNLFKESLTKANNYFEFGSGGSTIWASKKGLIIKGVESDVNWVNALIDKIGDSCQLDAVDIGPTKEWGMPSSMSHKDKFPNYSLAIDKHKDSFDLILVDGRFRVACVLTSILHIIKHHTTPESARIFIHDFWNRPQYHIVLNFLDCLERSESAGLFLLKPNINAKEVKDLWHKYAYIAD